MAKRLIFHLFVFHRRTTVDKRVDKVWAMCAIRAQLCTYFFRYGFFNGGLKQRFDRRFQQHLAVWILPVAVILGSAVLGILKDQPAVKSGFGRGAGKPG